MAVGQTNQESAAEIYSGSREEDNDCDDGDDSDKTVKQCDYSSEVDCDDADISCNVSERNSEKQDGSEGEIGDI